MIMLDCFFSQAELRSSAALTDVSVTAASSQDLVNSSTPLKDTEAGDSSSQTFYIHALNATIAPISSHNTLHQMLIDFQNLLPCNKLTCEGTLVHCSLCYNTSPQPKELDCLTKANSNLISCNTKLDLNLFLDLVTTYNSSIQCDLNDNAGIGIHEMNDSNDIMHESTNIFTICCAEDGFSGGLVNTGVGFISDSTSYITNFSLIDVSYTSEGETNMSLPEFLDTGSVVCVRGKRSCVALNCVFRNSSASASESLFDPGDSKTMYLHIIDKTVIVRYFDILEKQVYNNSLDISYLLMSMGGSDNTSELLSTLQSHIIVHDHSIPSQSSENSRCTMHYTSVVKFVELNNSEKPISSGCVFKTLYGGIKSTLLNSLTLLHPVCELTGMKVTWIFQSLCTVLDIFNFSVAQEILNNLKRNVLPVAPVHSGQIAINSKQCNYEIEIVYILLADFFPHHCSSWDRPALRQNCQAANCGAEAFSSQERSRVVDLASSCACIDNYSEFNFSRHNAQNLLSIADFRNKLFRDDLCSQIPISRVSHCASTSLVQLYPFCNCLLLHWLFSELLDGPILSLSFRYHYRSYFLVYFISQFKCWFFSLNNSLRKRLLCIICLQRCHLQC
jgi:hypothetical protein